MTMSDKPAHVDIEMPAGGADALAGIEVIDFRFRPVGARSVTRDQTFEYLRKMALQPCPSFEQGSVDLMLTEMDAAGIAKGVVGVPGPTALPGFDPTPSETVAELVATVPDRLIGFGSVDPSDVSAAIDRLDTIEQLGLVGVSVDPSSAAVSRHFDDREMYPLYEECAARKLPVTTTMSCLLGPYMDDCRPEYVERVAADVPALKLIIQHGGWPYSREAVGAAYARSNIYLCPGQYIHYGFPGSEDYITALGRQLPDQILFGSVYPNCGPLVFLREIVSSWNLSADIERRYLRGNALEVLGLRA